MFQKYYKNCRFLTEDGVNTIVVKSFIGGENDFRHITTETF